MASALRLDFRIAPSPSHAQPARVADARRLALAACRHLGRRTATHGIGRVAAVAHTHFIWFSNVLAVARSPSHTNRIHTRKSARAPFQHTHSFWDDNRQHSCAIFGLFTVRFSSLLCRTPSTPSPPSSPIVCVHWRRSCSCVFRQRLTERIRNKNGKFPAPGRFTIPLGSFPAGGAPPLVRRVPVPVMRAALRRASAPTLTAPPA